MSTTKFDFHKLAKDILSKREKEDVTIRQAAKLSKISSTRLYQIEAGISKAVSVIIFLKICDWLNVEPSLYFKKSVSSKKQVKNEG